MQQFILYFIVFSRHGRAVLDLTVPVFYANLPNRAKLEAVKGVGVGSTRTPPTTDVLIAIQLPSGERLQERCSATTTLWDVVMKAAPCVSNTLL